MKPALIIFQKELRDMFRDRRVRNSALIMPAFISLMMMMLFGFLQTSVGKPKNQKIHVVHNGSALIEQFKKSGVSIVEVASVDEGKKLLQQGKARIVLEFPPDGVATDEGKTSTVSAYYDPKSELSGISMNIVQRTFDEVNRKVLAERLKAHNLPQQMASAIKVEKKEVTEGGKVQTADLAISLVPYFIVMWAFYGGMSIGSELVAGEKEKNTLETLLISPASRKQIVLGKFLALAVLCILSSTMSYAGIAFGSTLSANKELFPNGLGVTPGMMLLMELVLLPTVAFFASILLTISSYAKNTREAQGYLAAMSSIVVFPIVFNQFIGYTEFANSPYLSAIPIMNTGNAMRQILQNRVNYGQLGITVGVSIVLALIGIAIVIRLFNREQVITRV